MEKIWLQNYSQGVPAEIDDENIPSLVSLFEAACLAYADQVAYICMGRKLTYRQLAAQSRAFAAWLQSLGLPKGERVALMMPNILQYPVALFGSLQAGCIVVNCNPLYTPRELAQQLKDSGATVIVIVENFAHTLAKIVADTAIKHVVVTPLGEMLGPVKASVLDFMLRYVKKMVPAWTLPGAINFRRALAIGQKHGFKSPVLASDAVAFLQYTGGTTGVAKGAMLSHANIAANVTQARAWIKPVIRDGEEFIITALPLYHIFALTANCLTFLTIGATNLLIVNPRDTARFIREWRKYPVTVVTGVNTLFNALLSHPEFAKLDFSRLKIALGGGMAVQAAVAERWLKTTTIPLLQAYGLTETSPAVTMNPLDMQAFNGSIGLPIPSTEISIRHASGRELPLNQIGEICVRGPQVMHGYWQRPDETELVFYPDQFLRTGDLGYVDQKGFLFLVDRSKDTIIVSGFNVYPSEVEEVIAMYPGVRDVAAIGVPEAHSGEAVKIFVVRDDPSITEGVLIEHCRNFLTGYKIPRHVEFRDDLPRSNVGKVLRRALKDET